MVKFWYSEEKRGNLSVYSLVFVVLLLIAVSLLYFNYQTVITGRQVDKGSSVFSTAPSSVSSESGSGSVEVDSSSSTTDYSNFISNVATVSQKELEKVQVKTNNVLVNPNSYSLEQLEIVESDVVNSFVKVQNLRKDVEVIIPNQSPSLKNSFNTIKEAEDYILEVLGASSEIIIQRKLNIGISIDKSRNDLNDKFNIADLDYYLSRSTPIDYIAADIVEADDNFEDIESVYTSPGDIIGTTTEKCKISCKNIDSFCKYPVSANAFGRKIVPGKGFVEQTCVGFCTDGFSIRKTNFQRLILCDLVSDVELDISLDESEVFGFDNKPDLSPSISGRSVIIKGKSQEEKNPAFSLVYSPERKELDVSLIQTPPVYASECYDGIQNYMEEEVDCGGKCKNCIQEPQKQSYALYFWILFFISFFVFLLFNLKTFLIE